MVLVVFLIFILETILNRQIHLFKLTKKVNLAIQNYFLPQKTPITEIQKKKKKEIFKNLTKLLANFLGISHSFIKLRI